MKIIITGGAGFIASHIVDRLIGGGYEVCVIDNFSTGKKRNIANVDKVYECDICTQAIDKVFAEEKPDIVIHHAAQIDVQRSLIEPEFDAHVNIMGTINILNCCIRYGVKKIIYASSAAVYGVPQFLPIDENHPVLPISYYGVSKHTPEHYIKIYSDLYGLEYTILRYANVYGIRQDPKGEGGVVSIFLDKMLNGQQPIIYGDGNQTRDYIYVEDIAEANIKAINYAKNQILNISTNTQTTVTELYEQMSEIFGIRKSPVYKDERKGDIRFSCLDNSKAIKMLDWKPKFLLREGLLKTIDYYKEVLGNRHGI